MHDQYVAIPTSEVAMRDKEIERLKKELTECLAREVRLRESIHKTIEDNGHLADGDVCTLIDIKRALSIPTDDTALKEYKRKVLLDAADAASAIDGGECQISRGLRRMAEEDGFDTETGDLEVVTYDVPEAVESLQDALALPTDDTSLKEYKRKVLLDAAGKFAAMDGYESDSEGLWAKMHLRKMAEGV